MSWGYLGKAPARGDFIAHNVLPGTRDLLFEWCQSILAVSREQLGQDWLDTYLTSPIWHFSAGPGVILEEGVVGTMIPSVDRVGRHFPFIVLASYPGAGLDAWLHAEWASTMESKVLEVLEDSWDEQSWRQQLEAITQPAAAASKLRWPRGDGNIVLPGSARETDWLRALLERDAGMALWWTQGSASVEPVTLLTDGLPKVGQFASMLAGHWERHGWKQGELVAP